MIRRFITCSLFFGLSFSLVLTQPVELIDSAKVLLEEDELKTYHGWIKYLIFDVEVVAKRPDIKAGQVKKKEQRLRYWTLKLRENPEVLDSLRGVQEWAYESPVDGSGQPFMITIPVDYDSSRASPLHLYMHGYGGNHYEHFTGNDSLTGKFEISVLGRARGGRYVGLSRADVLQVLDYVETHWNIDPDRIHILGGSMGGFGTYRLGSEYPHRFASAHPRCGFASEQPFGNLMTLPIYAIHSNDDYVVSVLHSSGPLARLREIGTQVIFDSTTGYGHNVWNYQEGYHRSYAWLEQQKRPRPQDISHIQFTALDGNAVQCWWAEIVAWGTEPKPAKFILKAGENNMLYANLSNIQQLKLYIDESPFDTSKTLYISINSAPLLEVKKPLPPIIYLKQLEGLWHIADTTEFTIYKRHTPGGPNLLYNGEPLLIVYGTKGNKEDNEAMLNAAKAASRSYNAVWQNPDGNMTDDSIYHNQNLYGNLNIKADTGVSKEDIERCHLVLIGTARQNYLVSCIADRLPVSFSRRRIAFSDNEKYPSKNKGLGLVYYNPDAPDNLIFWVASNNHKLYRADSPVPVQMVYKFFEPRSSFPGYDCLISTVDNYTFGTARCFDSNWNWIPRSKKEEFISDSIKTNRQYIREISKAVRAHTGSDFAFTGLHITMNSIAAPVLPGVTRIEDLVTRYYYEPIGVMTLTGFDLLEMQNKLVKNGQTIYPEPLADNLEPEKTYTLALNQNSIRILVMMTEFTPQKYRLTDLQLADAIQRFFPRDDSK